MTDFETWKRDHEPELILMPVDAIVREVWKAATKAEREACAEICEAKRNESLAAQEGETDDLINVMLRHHAAASWACADDIRSRGGDE